jgi:cell wall-active antibiotic response 4TMS protein YvqF
METEKRVVSSIRPGSIVAGGILLALGSAALLDTTELMHLNFGRVIPPLVLIVLGVAILLDKGAFVVSRRLPKDEGGRRIISVRRTGGSLSGLWLIGVGAWMLASQMHLFGLSYHTSWPLFIVLAGVIMVLRGFMGPQCVELTREED